VASEVTILRSEAQTLQQAGACHIKAPRRRQKVLDSWRSRCTAIMPAFRAGADMVLRLVL
jgi:hypothetical protein